MGTRRSLANHIPEVGAEKLKVRFNPKTFGNLTSTLVLHSNDTYNPALSISLAGHGFHIVTSASGAMYGGTGINDNARLITLNPLTAAATAVGPSGYDENASLRVNPVTHEL